MNSNLLEKVPPEVEDLASSGETVAAPGTIDGMIYMRPEITLYAHLLVQPEIVVQGLALCAWVAWWMAANEHREAKFYLRQVGT